jgi:hypothetical protein
MPKLEFTENTMSFTFRVDWQTPDKYLEAARAVLGEISLDPISSDSAQERVKANRHYTGDDDGLKHDWYGTVWLNPAYSILSECVDKLIHHYRKGDILAAILFTHTLTTWEPWFQRALNFSRAFCFVNELVEWHPGHLSDMSEILKFRKAPEYDTRGTVAFYYGCNRDLFKEHFSKFGAIK